MYQKTVFLTTKAGVKKGWLMSYCNTELSALDTLAKMCMVFTPTPHPHPKKKLNTNTRDVSESKHFLSPNRVWFSLFISVLKIIIFTGKKENDKKN